MLNHENGLTMTPDDSVAMFERLKAITTALWFLVGVGFAAGIWVATIQTQGNQTAKDVAEIKQDRKDSIKINDARWQQETEDMATVKQQQLAIIEMLKDLKK